MTRLLDSRTSQNATDAFLIIEPVPPSTPVLIGQVGLNIFNPSGIIRVQFWGIAALFANITANTGVNIFVVRGVDPFTDPVVFRMTGAQTVADSGTAKEFSFTGSDYNVPAPVNNQLVYTMFILALNDISFRVGPESFNAAAYSD
jgi:hypothetical protein